MNIASRPAKQLVGNIGLYYICYELSKRGWNVLPTSRNARGIDIVIYSQNAAKKHTIQIKSLSKRAPVPLGSRENGMTGDFLIICRNVFKNPEIFVATKASIESEVHKGKKDGRISFWLQPKDYEKYKDKWNTVGSGY